MKKKSFHWLNNAKHVLDTELLNNLGRTALDAKPEIVMTVCTVAHVAVKGRYVKKMLAATPL